MADELINRKALLEDIEETVRFTVQKDVPSAEMRGANKVIDRIKAAPTIDPESLRPQGEWVEWYPPKHMIMTGEELLYRCSACDAKYADVEGYRYCPYCGAYMKGAGEDA